MFPENLVQACFQSMQTYYVAKTPVDENGTELTTLAPLMLTTASNVTVKPVELFERRFRYIDGMNVLGTFPSSSAQHTLAMQQSKLANVDHVN